MTRPIIEVENLSKRYKLGQFNARALREEAEQFFARFRNKGARTDGELSSEHSEIWALKDIAFSVQPGEVIGIVGRNGAGKSTLLKILSRITEPTTGEARIRGRIASLLEVGTGFHPELSGRENIYLNGAILGMTRAEVKAKFDEIVTFAEVERFLDTPVKRYSSGMCVRLGFAVAAHLEPEILIVDEVLAVGDADFQKKCLGRMRSVSSGEGRTVLFVSHNMTAINSLCHRAMLINGGHAQQIGPARDVTQVYITSSSIEEQRSKSWSFDDAPGDARFKIKRIEITPDGADVTAPIHMGTGFQIETDYWNLIDNADVVLELIVRGDDGTAFFHSYSTESGAGGRYLKGLYRSSCWVPGNLLNAGRFGIEMYLSDGRPSKEFGLIDAVSVLVHELNDRHNLSYYGRFIGHVHPKLKWRTVHLAADINEFTDQDAAFAGAVLDCK
jgi:lipopolysaccharide transport system ATP-binding protein